MKTTIELPEDQASALTELGKARHLSADDVIREAISEYLDQQAFLLEDSTADTPNKRLAQDHESAREGEVRSVKDHPAFGMWKGRGIDGVEYQRRLRAEWDHRP